MPTGGALTTVAAIALVIEAHSVKTVTAATMAAAAAAGRPAFLRLRRLVASWAGRQDGLSVC
jgi:hypothetical protein